MTRTVTAPPKPIQTNTNPLDGKVTFFGFHDKLAKARPDTMATLLTQTRPPFSALARNVKQYPNGVTAYDITPVGPKFAYKVQGQSNFSMQGPDGKTMRFSIVEVKIGPDKQTGAKSVYEGRAYEIFGEGPNGTWAAELWDNVKADSIATDAAANLHNGIVDGSVGQGGFRGLAKDAAAIDKKNEGAMLKPEKPIGKVAVTDSLLAFVSDPKAIPGLTPEARKMLLAKLQG